MHSLSFLAVPGLVRTFLENGERIDVKKVDSHGKTALHYAATLCHCAIATELVSVAPSLLYVFDSDGNSPLHVVAIRGYDF